MTCGSRMPLGKLLRIWVILSRMSVTARSIGVPMANWTKVCDWPSVTVELSSSIPSIVRTAASTRWVTCVSSSVGAAPGWAMMTIAPGKSMSGSLWTPIMRKETMPATVRPKNMTSGGIGFRMDQAEIFLKFILSPLSGHLPRRLRAFSPRCDRDRQAGEARSRQLRGSSLRAPRPLHQYPVRRSSRARGRRRRPG